MVANEGNVDALRLARLENGHALGNLVLVAVDLDANELALRLYKAKRPATPLPAAKERATFIATIDFPTAILEILLSISD